MAASSADTLDKATSLWFELHCEQCDVYADKSLVYLRQNNHDYETANGDEATWSIKISPTKKSIRSVSGNEED